MEMKQSIDVADPTPEPAWTKTPKAVPARDDPPAEPLHLRPQPVVPSRGVPVGGTLVKDRPTPSPPLTFAPLRGVPVGGTLVRGHQTPSRPLTFAPSRDVPVSETPVRTHTAAFSTALESAPGCPYYTCVDLHLEHKYMICFSIKFLL